MCGSLATIAVIFKRTASHTRLRAKQKPDDETGLLVFYKEVEFMRWFPVAFLANSIFIEFIAY